MTKIELNRANAEAALENAALSNPGAWIEHCRYVAMACRNIASRCQALSAEDAYIYGLLHDIGRHLGVYQNRHLIEGYHYCMERGWEKTAQICISHAYMSQDIKAIPGDFDMSEADYRLMDQLLKNMIYDDYDLLVQLCDALALPSGFCLLEKRFVDVTIRYGMHPSTIERWIKIYEIKKHFEEEIGCFIYDLLPGVIENSFR